MKYDLKDIELSKRGKLRIEWAENFMPVLSKIKDRFFKEKPLKDIRVGACLHVTTETANLMRTLKAGGADVMLCASNPLTTQDDVSACLVKDYKISVFAIKGESEKTYYSHISKILDNKPQVILDDGADTISQLHLYRKQQLSSIFGGIEETTTGVIRLRSMEKEGILSFPIIAANDAETKYLFDNRYGTGQSSIDGILRATNRMIAGSIFVVCGYGWCGRGVAMRAKGMGAQVIITEVDPIVALEAAMEGFQVMPISEASEVGDIFITATGDIRVIGEKHIKLMKDKTILCNTGHFNVEIDINALEKLSKSKRKVRDFVDEYILYDGRRIYLLAEGRLINSSAAEGHPASIMDMSFSNQALSVEYLIKNKEKLENKVYKVPMKIDNYIAELKLKSMNIKIDKLTKEQQKYLTSWRKGT